MAFALLTLVILAAGSRADSNWNLETKILDTVQEVADIMNNQSFLLVDGYYGITLAEVQMKLLLDWLRDQGTEKCPIGRHVAQTEVKLRKVLQASEQIREHDDPLCTSTNDEDLAKFRKQGTPNEEQSDHCLIGLINNCTVSQRCWDAQTLMKPPPHGYPLTHRLLFYQIARQLNCESSPSFAHINIGATIRHMCEKVLVDSKTIEHLNYPKKINDLFTEQVVLCGIEGFREFINRKWTEKILSWKVGSGCFPETAKFPRLHRTDFVVGDCSMHFSGLAAAALSISLRSMMQDIKIFDCMKF